MDLRYIKLSLQAYARGKLWYWYVPLWLLGAYAFVMLLGMGPNKPLPLVLLIPNSFDFLLHEWAHIVTAFLPPVLTASAGSLSELLLGISLIITALWTRSYFASLFSCLWFALACQSAGIYMADAIPQRLQLFSLGAALTGGEARHDWHFVFGQLHILPFSYFIGDSVRIIGLVVASLALLFSAWLIYQMATLPTTAAELAAKSSTVEEPKPDAPAIHLADSFGSAPIDTSAYEKRKQPPR